jgi:hypothetical protein
MSSEKAFDQWALVEIMGHSRYAGRVTEETIGGCAFVRVDVPETPDCPAFTKLFGQASIFCITPVGEQEARNAARNFRSRPVDVFYVRPPAEEPARIGAVGSDVDDDPDEFDDEYEEL